MIAIPDLSFLDDDAPPVGRTAEPWDSAEAARLESTADDLVGRLGASGSDPEIRAAAERGVAAHLRNDMAGVRAAVAEVERRAHELHRGQSA